MIDGPRSKSKWRKKTSLCRQNDIFYAKNYFLGIWKLKKCINVDFKQIKSNNLLNDHDNNNRNNHNNHKHFERLNKNYLLNNNYPSKNFFI